MPRWKKFLLALLTVAATGALTAGAWYTWKALHRCAEGVERIEDECIGVNGDGYDFGTPEIRDVARDIAAENADVERRNAQKKDREPYVTVAMMLPLQAGSNAKHAGQRREILSDLQGAYLGQREVNRQEGRPPNIKLVLANPGRGYRHQKEVVDSLVDMATSKDNLRAVTGFNLSLGATKEAVRSLTARNVPVLASRLSGDTIANKETGDAGADFPGLARIIPTNNDAARALADFNRAKVRQDEDTVVVYDDRAKDDYTTSLREAFQNIDEEGDPGQEAQKYQSTDVDSSGSTGSQFSQIARNICAYKARTIYFAGRTQHLRLFARTLTEESCSNRHYTLISGSDAASLQQLMTKEDWSVLRNGGNPRVKVQYAAPAHPDAWDTEIAAWRDKNKGADCGQKGKQPPQYLCEPKAALDRLHRRIGKTYRNDPAARPSLDNSRTMLVYDGIFTIGAALHADSQRPPDEIPGLKAIGTQWSFFSADGRIKGTSGLICLTNSGNPDNKPVSVVELDPGTKGLGTLEFKGLGWPQGQPQSKDCVIRSDKR